VNSTNNGQYPDKRLRTVVRLEPLISRPVQSRERFFSCFCSSHRVNSQVGMQEQKVELLHVSDVFVAHRGSFMGAAECIERERAINTSCGFLCKERGSRTENGERDTRCELKGAICCSLLVVIMCRISEAERFQKSKVRIFIECRVLSLDEGTTAATMAS
jgi:hypothetical protein